MTHGGRDGTAGWDRQPAEGLRFARRRPRFTAERLQYLLLHRVGQRWSLQRQRGALPIAESAVVEALEPRHRRADPLPFGIGQDALDVRMVRCYAIERREALGEVKELGLQVRFVRLPPRLFP